MRPVPSLLPWQWLPAPAWQWVLGCLLLLVHAGEGCQAATDRLLLRDDVPSVNVWPAVTVLADPTRLQSVQDAMARAPDFSAPPGTSGTLGVRSDAMWIRIPLTVSPTSDGIWIADIDYPVLNRVEVYLTTDGHVSQQATLGSLQPFSQRPLRSRTHALALAMQPGHDYDLLLRVETRGAMVLPVTLNKPTAWHSAAMNEQMLQGILTGLALCLLVYSLAQWINLRDVLFIQYALLLTGSLLFSLHLFGLGTQYLWQDSLWFEVHAAGLSALMATCGSFLFISQALVGHRPKSLLLRTMRGGALLCVLLAFIHALDILSTPAVAAIVSILGLVPALMGIPGAVRRARQGDPVGSSLLLAWLVYFAATATVIGVIRGWVPVNFWTLHSFEFGATLDMLLFMRVLGLRTKALRLEALDANRERDAMRSLAHTDPLTGLPNRRGLNIALASALARCGPDKLLAVYVMDLDGFKPVNDQHGHDVGDELLVAVTRRLQGHVRQSDVVARLGGDEFVVMTGHLGSEQQAQELGHKLLDAFRSPFSLGNVRVEVGLTIGYAIAPDDSNDAIGLLKLADAAMYSGKQGGKFCLRRNTGDLALSSA
ncbi:MULTISPECIES: diguanylate cyclase [unclassified Acidovorax]|uniref:diguanylate cyclase n=1 Tax=unclassified Acidovorax TaxID=2684926 RepID=UPI001C4499D0|nr:MULTISPECIES: diguanylate cyclase [unclassified Acidovorax]MBV7431246.1 sensor domain-containing diguanylate cyclase [Acidovorax sp. sif0732]MBV7452352.1 sensor domain-containing diguanylate cyclase [Acidovorax sp. sif0715]